MVKVTFKGGPRDGRVKEYARDPMCVACAPEAHAKGMHGLYKTPRDTWRTEKAEVVATWYEMPRETK